METSVYDCESYLHDSLICLPDNHSLLLPHAMKEAYPQAHQHRYLLVVHHAPRSQRATWMSSHIDSAISEHVVLIALCILVSFSYTFTRLLQIMATKVLLFFDICKYFSILWKLFYGKMHFHPFVPYNLAPVALYVSPFRMISNCPSRSTFVLCTSSLVPSIPSCGSTGSVPGSGVGCADTITVTGITSSIANSVFESAL